MMEYGCRKFLVDHKPEGSYPADLKKVCAYVLDRAGLVSG